MTRGIPSAVLAVVCLAALSFPAPADSAATMGGDSSSVAASAHSPSWAPASTDHWEPGINFGLLQLALGGFNVAGELRHRRLWLEYSHGMNLKLNSHDDNGLTNTEKNQDLHIDVPYTTGAGVGFTVLKELWLGVEVKAHEFKVNARGGPVSTYQTYSVGPVLGYKFFIVRGLHVNAYGRWWPNVATSLADDKITLQGSNGPVVHDAHEFGLFANLALGYAFGHKPGE